MFWQHNRACRLFVMMPDVRARKAHRSDFIRHILAQERILSVSFLYRLSCTENSVKVQPGFVPPHASACCLCRSRVQCWEERTTSCCCRNAIWLGRVRSYLQKETGCIKKNEKERDRQVVTSYSKCFRKPPAIPQTWPRAHQALRSPLSAALWLLSSSTNTTSPRPGLTLWSWRTKNCSGAGGP